MRRNLLLSVCFLMASVLFAGPVTKQQAQEMAAQFLAGKSITHRAASASQMRAEVVMNAVDEAGQPYLYAVQPDNQRGFVIVSGDDRFRDFLGYSESGTFDNANMPDNMRAWLQGYVDEMKHLKAIGYQPSASAAHRTSGVKKAISPLIQTHWDQGAPYNDICKNYFVYNDAVTGCVATAMAQVMYYSAQKHGDNTYTTTVEIPGYTTGYNYSVPAVSAGTVINWSNMLPEYTYSYNNSTGKYDIANFTNEQGTAVATLMKCCGVSVHMDYANSASGGSSASTSAVPNALITYFGYDGTVRKMSRDAYTLATWTEIIYGELAAARPVLYDGQSSGGGHAFVVDGYDGDELFHVNWGWGGSQDNYFALSVMNPGDKSGIGAGTSNDGYSYSQGAVIGIQIGSGEVVKPTPVTIGIKSFTISGSSVLLSAFNWTGSPQTFDVGIGAVDAEGTITVIEVLRSNWVLQETEGLYDMPCAFGKDGTKANQVLKVVPISKLSSEDKWATDFNYDKRYIEVAYDAEGNPTLTSYPLDPVLSVTSFSFTGSKYNDEEQPVVVTLGNTGGEFYGVLYLFASTDSNNKGTYVNKGGVTVLKDKTASLTFDWTPATSGTYHIWVATDSEGSNVIGTSTVNITEAPSLGETSSNVDLTFTQVVLNAENLNVVGKIAKVKVSVTNSTDVNFQGSIGLFTWKWNGGSGSANGSGKTVVVPAHSAVDVEFESKELTGADRYSFTVYYYKGDIRTEDQTKIYDYYMPIDGYTTYDANGNAMLKKSEASITVDADVAYVDLCGQTTTNTITSQANPNTLFLVDEGFKLTGATNVIVKTSSGYQASNIVLQDNENGFVSPVDFTATKMTYTRTFDKFYDNGKNWTTIVLPFAVSKVTVTNTSGVLPWDEANRKFWLMEFSGESGSTVNFTTAPTPLEANVPYIIALPGADQGSLSLVGKNTLTFEGDNVSVKANAKSAVTVSKYKYVGAMTNTGSLHNIYALNDDGDKFQKGTASVTPFRAYFAGTSAAATATSLGIGFGGNTTGIAELKPSRKVEDNNFYNLNGQRVSQPKKGLYIVNGNKVVIK